MKKLRLTIEEHVHLRRAAQALYRKIDELTGLLESMALPRPFTKDATSARLAAARLRARFMQAALDDHGIEGFDKIEAEAARGQNGESGFDHVRERKGET